MKRQYIAPSLLVVKVEMRSVLMDMSVHTDKEIELNGENSGDFGLTREDNIIDNRGSIWDNAWWIMVHRSGLTINFDNNIAIPDWYVPAGNCSL